MSKAAKPLSYPIIIREEGHYLTISVPDFSYVRVLQHPVRRNLLKENDSYAKEIGKEILRAWKASADKLINLRTARMKFPKASRIKETLSKVDEETLSPHDVAKFLGCSRFTIQRAIDRGDLEAITTPGGHRRVLRSVAKAWLKHQSKPEKGRPKKDPFST